MNYWFEDKDELTYVGKIPDSVKTMIRTFSDCESLEPWLTGRETMHF